MRLPKADIAIIDRAATLHRRSRTEFVRDAAVRAAEAVLLESTLIHVSPAAFKEIMNRLDEPPQIVSDIARIMQMKAPWEK
ncbi:MAG TPA: DUF1778 domain-containing protein [Rhizomicrobium sp.]|nr:DUF1778 domain-containing protein [Rhizomicrobium sp.]